MDENKVETMEKIASAVADSKEELVSTGIVEVAKDSGDKTLPKIIAVITVFLAGFGLFSGIKKLISKIKTWKEKRKIKKAEKEGLKVVDADDYEVESVEEEEPTDSEK